MYFVEINITQDVNPRSAPVPVQTAPAVPHAPPGVYPALRGVRGASKL